MAAFIIGSTPKFSITLSGGESFSELGTKFFRLVQGETKLDITPEISEDELTANFTLTQEQTLLFEKGNIQCQLMGVSGLDASEVVRKSEIFTVLAKPSLITEAIHNEPNDEPDAPEEPDNPAEPENQTEPTEPENPENNGGGE